MIALIILIGAIGLVALLINRGAQDRAEDQKDLQYRTLRLQDPDTYHKICAQDEKRAIATFLFWVVVIGFIIYSISITGP